MSERECTHRNGIESIGRKEDTRDSFVYTGGIVSPVSPGVGADTQHPTSVPIFETTLETHSTTSQSSRNKSRTCDGVSGVLKPGLE
ncbi:hypothetical protein WN51_09622 [Melipona quadrifasciata]|uniref:Uncharacterized protein n=1 Tax=Melipona quadrifasciata TaxID=166423 RepID=A0A0M8ZMQ0_9HYME|nr:hypothetical protein WN51_09622 [Melipona quadrifasciata]